METYELFTSGLSQCFEKLSFSCVCIILTDHSGMFISYESI